MQRISFGESSLGDMRSECVFETGGRVARAEERTEDRGDRFAIFEEIFGHLSTLFVAIERLTRVSVGSPTAA